MSVVDVREHAHALADTLLTGFATGGLREALDAVRDADAVIAVTPVFQASYSGLFKTFVDVLDDGALRGHAGADGRHGRTARHSLVLEHALRPMFAYLKAITVPTGVFAASEDWGGGGAVGRRAVRPDQRRRRGAGRPGDRAGRPGPRARVDEFADPVPFEELLAR